MIRVLNHLVLPAGFALGLLLGTGCNSGDTQTVPTAAPGAPTSAPSIREVAENSATATAADAGTLATATEPTGTDVPGVTAKASFSPLSKLSSFNYTMSMEFSAHDAPGGDQSGSLTIEGAYVAPDRSSLSMSFELPKIEGLTLPSEVKAVVIGKDVYTNLGGEWQKSSLDDLGLNSLMPTQEDFYKNFSVDGLEGVAAKDEVKNGVATKHYTLGAADIGRLLSQSAAPAQAGLALDSLKDVSADFWVANEGGYVVAIDVNAVIDPSAFAGVLQSNGGPDLQGATIDFGFKFDLNQINSGEIQIQPPI